MIHAREKDGMPGKWNGLGGKLEQSESMREACVREFAEEAGCATKAQQWTWLAQLYFPNFKAHRQEDWWVNVFVTVLTQAQAKSILLHDESAREGPLSFVAANVIPKLDLWDGDRFFLPFVLNRIPFEGTFYYENGHCTRHEISPILIPGV